MLRLYTLFIGALLISAPSATPASTPQPGDIGKSWPDRRPMGRITLAQSEDISDSNLNGWVDCGPNAMGVAAFQQDILSRVNSAIANVIKMHGQGLIVWDITGCGKTASALPSEEYLGDPRFLDPKGSSLTVKTDYGPYVPPTSTLGLSGVEPAMNAIADQIFASIRSAGLNCGVCLRAEKVSVNANGDLDGSVSADGQLVYDTVAQQLADLDAKLTYTYNRWGCRIFYVDSNVASQDVYSSQQAQNNPTWAPAWVYTQLNLRHPDCVIFPEEHYYGSFRFSNPVIKDPAYQYERVASRYTELRNPWQGPFISSAESIVVPDSFTLICVTNMGSSDPADTPTVIAALKKNECIFLVDSWYDDPGITLVINWQIAAEVNGF
jgi:hypothetical protein